MKLSLRILDFFQRKRLFQFNVLICRLMYFTKGKLVTVKYHSDFRAYEFRVDKIAYMSSGAGWAYSFEYLQQILLDSFCYHYRPKEGDCVIDIGAGLGEESLIMAQWVTKTGLVLAIEANPVTYGVMEDCTS